MVDQEIVEGEVVEKKEEANTPVGDDQATVLLSLENLIKHNISSVDKLKEELKKNKQMLEDSFVSDSIYQEQEKQAKDAVKKKNATKQQITKQQANVNLNNKIRSMSAELKEKQLAMSDYLLEYQRMTGVNEIEGEDGQIREIVNTAKVIKRPSKK